MASVDLDWAALDTPLASALVDLLNRQLSNIKRPTFIGPVKVHSLDFGSLTPEVEILDIQDIYPDFLEDDDDLIDNEGGGLDGDRKQNQGGGEDGAYEWVDGVPVDLAESERFLPYIIFNALKVQWYLGPPLYPTSDSWPHLNTASLHPLGLQTAFLQPGIQRPISRSSPRGIPPSPAPQTREIPAVPPPSRAQHPDLQLRIKITHISNIRLAFSTSLLINHPSPVFMSLPMKLCVTGYSFCGEVIVAYEGSRRRVHLCIVDDQDVTSPLRRPESANTENVPSPAGQKPTPVGQRLFPNIVIESEIGDTDKHVLKNVSRVERFIQDVIRKTIEEELVFPNFHTLVLGERSS